MMAQCFQQSHEAYARRDGALAKDLSSQGKEHQRKMEEFNKQASDWIFIGAQFSLNLFANIPTLLENNKVLTRDFITS
jgi:uncharacterized protein HemX